MSIVFALLAALSSAANLLTQRVSSGAGPSGSPWRLAMYLLRQPLWLLGAAAAVGSFLFQAVALHYGSLSVVQPVLVTELVFVLVIRRVWLRQQIRPAAWGSAGLTCLALAVFLAAAEPRGGTAGATASAWVGAVSVCGGASVALTVLGIRGSPVRRAALYGTAAAIVAALAATFIKELTNVLSVDGPVAAVSSWPLYAVIVSSVASGLLVQAALHVGPLTVSQPLLVVIDPIVSIWLSVWLFAEYFTESAGVIAVAAGAFAALIVGVVLLTQTAPRQDTGPGSPDRPAEQTQPSRSAA